MNSAPRGISTPHANAGLLRRLQELNARPEHDRSDAEWDEMNDLEITLALAPQAAPRPAEARNVPAAPRAQDKPIKSCNYLRRNAYGAKRAGPRGGEVRS